MNTERIGAQMIPTSSPPPPPPLRPPLLLSPKIQSLYLEWPPFKCPAINN